MTADTIQQIAKMARNESPIVLAPDHAWTGRYYVRDADGGLVVPEQIADVLPWLATRHDDTRSLARKIASDMAAGPRLEGVYFDRHGIVAYLTDDGGDRWTHAMPLPTHPVFDQVVALHAPRAFTQRALIQWLRATMNGHVGDDTVEAFRALRLTTDGTTDTVVAKGREGVDRKIAATIRQQAGADVPDMLTFHVPVYDVDQVRLATYPVQVLVDVQASDDGPVFSLTSVLNSVRMAQHDATKQLRAMLVRDMADADLSEADLFDGTATTNQPKR
jgi:hypothetical protein